MGNRRLSFRMELLRTTAVWDRRARGSSNLKKQSSPSEVILEVGAEGGTLTLVRERIGGAEWQFRMGRDEEAIYDLLLEEDRGKIGNYFARTECVKSFPEALNLLDKYPWFRLQRLYVHPEFLDAILLEVGIRGGVQQEARWREQLKQS